MIEYIDMSQIQAENFSEKRIEWIDQAKGLTIFLVVYGHNFPFCEKFIYSFHMPLFIMMAGFFHPKKYHLNNIKKRISHVLFPYFVWSLLLFLFWFIIGKNYGDSGNLNLSSAKNFLGVFYAQGGREYMDWGIPLWFLPFIFITFLIFHWFQKIKNTTVFYIILLLTILIGFLYSRYFEFNLPWSINIAMVGILFYGMGYLGFKTLNSISQKNSILIAIASGILLYFLYNFNIKIDMYRATYGNEFLFIINGIVGSFFVLFFFKAFPIFKFLGFVGKFSLLILCLQLLALTFIKFVFLYGFGQNNFNFTEWEKFIYAIVQIILIIPVFLIVNNYFPLLNGGSKKI
jgi:acyltransferase